MKILEIKHKICTGKLINTTKVGEILDVNIIRAAQIMQTPDYIEDLSFGNVRNYYDIERVKQVHKDRRKNTYVRASETAKQNKHKRKSKPILKYKHCACGRLFLPVKQATKCPVCLTGKDKNDPYNVKHVPKKQKRKCPKCGGDLWDNEYLCLDCKPPHWGENDLNEYEAYGEIIV